MPEQTGLFIVAFISYDTSGQYLFAVVFRRFLMKWTRHSCYVHSVQTQILLTTATSEMRNAT